MTVKSALRFFDFRRTAAVPFSTRSFFVARPSRRDFQSAIVVQNGQLQGKELKQHFKAQKSESKKRKAEADTKEDKLKSARWDLTVGLEIHAQLNTERKLFSYSKTSVDAGPNTHVSPFDLAFPGSQPQFQEATLIPALRAACALNCNVQRSSSFDRKHYFYQDQPAGYQITQYYRPFARKGHVDLFEQDGVDPAELPVSIGIQQIQMEQDTARSTTLTADNALVDFNRAGHPLIEIITLPQMHSPRTAAACAKKIQTILQAVNAVTTGMEMGGLRVDVNVSVSPKRSTTLGQRTEIKNLSSFKAIEQAIMAEKDRQIDLLESGGSVQGETRGWNIGDTHTIKLRSKEGEVDYRYMPDPDIPPLLIDEALVDHIRSTLPLLPDTVAADLVAYSGLTSKDARTLIALEDGRRLDYFDDVCDRLVGIGGPSPLPKDLSRIVGNWVIHELGGHLSATGSAFDASIVPAKEMATIIFELHRKTITGMSAKRLLAMVFEDSNLRGAADIIKDENMTVHHLSPAQYRDMAQSLIEQYPDKADQVRKGQSGKLKFLVGQMMRLGDGNVDPARSEASLKDAIEDQGN